MSETFAGVIEKWRERVTDALKDAQLDEEFEQGNAARAAWIATCADELALLQKRVRELRDSLGTSGWIREQLTAILGPVEKAKEGAK